MGRYGQRPENALKRANEFIEVGKPARALDTLQKVFRNKKWAYNWSESVLQPIMFKYFDLRVQLKNSHIAKEGLFQYRNMFQSENVGSLENVIRGYLRMAEEKTENSREQLAQAVIDIDDLDNLATPESILLSWDMLDPSLPQTNVDVNYKNRHGQTCLHVALRQSSVNIAHKLIEYGADVNARDRRGQTVLHYAVGNNDLEAVCMLLYHEIDISTLCNANMTAFILALCNNRMDLAEALCDYYDSSDDKYSYWALNLVEVGAEVNWEPTPINNPLVHSLHHGNAKLFKLIWPKFNHRQLLELERSFIDRFISDTEGFSASDWVESMYLILESPVAFEILNCYIDIDSGCVSLLLTRLKKLEVKQTDPEDVDVYLLNFV